MTVHFKNDFDNDNYGWTQYSTYVKPWNADGKFNAEAVNKLKEMILYYEKEATEHYIENPEYFISEKKKELEEINRLTIELQNKIKVYNTNMPHGFKDAKLKDYGTNKFERE